MDYHWSTRRGGPDQQQNAAMSRLPPQGVRKASIEVTLFDIEKDGDPRISCKGELRYPCCVPHCSVEPFPRHSELERHFKLTHEGSTDIYCDYQCGVDSTGGGGSVFRLDKIQDHYRDQHNEDLLKPNDDAAKIEKFLAQKVGGGLVSLAWWRCGKCKQRVMVRDDDYQCPRCKLLCEPERVAWRRSMVYEMQGSYGGGQGMESDAYSEDLF